MSRVVPHNFIPVCTARVFLTFFAGGRIAGRQIPGSLRWASSRNRQESRVTLLARAKVRKDQESQNRARVARRPLIKVRSGPGLSELRRNHYARAKESQE